MTRSCGRCGLFHPSDKPCLAGTRPFGGSRDGLPDGSVLAGRYRIERTIQRGGMSIVYLATDSLLQQRQVAVKELRPRQDSEASRADYAEAEAWFARESYLLSTLRHALIPAFYSVFREDACSYIVQEYVPGETLEALVDREGPCAETTVIPWAVALCGLLTYLHEREEPILYRDLKPANIIVRAPQGRSPDDLAPLAVVDFGIARPFAGGVAGTVIGTPGYAPPEQYQGLATPQSDLYALGATLHRLLTGYDPERGLPFVFPNVRALNPDVSPELAAVLARAVALDPQARYQSAAQLALALQELARRRGSYVHASRPAPSFQGSGFSYGTATQSRRGQHRLVGLFMCLALLAPAALSQLSAHSDPVTGIPAFPSGVPFSATQTAPQLGDPPASIEVEGPALQSGSGR